MAFVHGHARETGWVVSHYRRPQRAGDDQLDLIDPALPVPRRGDGPDVGTEDGADDQLCESTEDDPEEPDAPDEPASVRSIPRRTASTR